MVQKLHIDILRSYEMMCPLVMSFGLVCAHPYPVASGFFALCTDSGVMNVDIGIVPDDVDYHSAAAMHKLFCPHKGISKMNIPDRIYPDTK